MILMMKGFRKYSPRRTRSFADPELARALRIVLLIVCKQNSHTVRLFEKNQKLLKQCLW